MPPTGVLMSAERSVRTNDPSLENCILLLDCRQRAVFIMRNVLRMSWPTVAGASGSSVEDAKESWPTASAILKRAGSANLQQFTINQTCSANTATSNFE